MKYKEATELMAEYCPRDEDFNPIPAEEVNPSNSGKIGYHTHSLRYWLRRSGVTPKPGTGLSREDLIEIYKGYISLDQGIAMDKVYDHWTDFEMRNTMSEDEFKKEDERKRKYADYVQTNEYFNEEVEKFAKFLDKKLQPS